MTSLGDPGRYGVFLDRLCPTVSAAALAEVEQAVAHWRAAGWSDLAIGAVIANAQTTFGQRVYCVQALRRAV